jgi:HD-GYP domain-containing protein (c-di-GMP phosphodiesterase class II)
MRTTVGPSRVDLIMPPLCLVCTSQDRAAAIGQNLTGAFAVRAIGLDQLAHQIPDALTLIDIDLDDAVHADELRCWLQRRPNDGAAVFAVDKGSRVQTVRAYSIGATDILVRPFRPEALLAKLRRDRGVAPVDAQAAPILHCDGVGAGISALQEVFSSASKGMPIRTEVLIAAADALMAHIEAHGIADWVRAVRVHHSRTYQHCLLVSGAAAAFGQQLGFSEADRRRVAIASLLHDVGKAGISVAILEKPGKLDDHEMAEMRRHVVLGHEALQGTVALHPEMLDTVLHHHEYLDGSGYPHGLRGGDISELTRVVTIVDVFGALIEQRAYKPPLTGQAAYDIMVSMGPKLDQTLVQAFELLSLAQFE